MSKNAKSTIHSIWFLGWAELMVRLRNGDGLLPMLWLSARKKWDPDLAATLLMLTLGIITGIKLRGWLRPSSESLRRPSSNVKNTLRLLLNSMPPYLHQILRRGPSSARHGRKIDLRPILSWIHEKVCL